jgi:RimJ/RimL family protein N-acetyltransferase
MIAKEHKFPKEIYGEFIILRKMIKDDADFIYILRSQKGAEFLTRPEGYSIKTQEAWQKSRLDDEVNYIIYNGSFRVGMISIYECDWLNGVSNVGHLLLDNQYVHNHKPYGLEALKICYGYVFKTMGFRKISGTINSQNVKVINLQSYLGMRTEGYFCKHVLLNGVAQDVVFMSLMDYDFPGYESKIDGLLEKYRNIKTGAYAG